MDNLENHLNRLEEYINKRLSKGHKPKHIKKTLLEHGWKDHHIKNFLKEEEQDERHDELIETGKEKEEQTKGIKITKSFIHETEFDKLYNIIQEKGKIKLKEVMSIFKINKMLAEKWVDILKKAGLVDIYEPAIGDIEIRKKK